MNRADGNDFPPIPNPYIVGNPIEDRRMFFGREDDFAYIQQKVTGSDTGGLIVLCGTRRSGKTSILFQIKGGRLGEGFVPVLVDMQSMTVNDDAEFLDKLAKAIIAAVVDPALSYERDYKALRAENPFDAFQSLIQGINASLKGRKLILMFDEYEIFESHIENKRLSKDILHLLANWMESRQGVFIVFTGSDKLEARSTDCWESFLGKALHRRISFLSRNDTLRLITEPLVDLICHDEGVPEEIYDLTAGQPFYTQVLCQSLVDHLNEDRKYEVEAEDVHNAVSEIIENPLPHMVFTWSSLSDLEKVTLSVTAELSKTEARPVLPGEIQAYTQEEDIGVRLDENKTLEALERLFHHDLLEKGAAGENYRYKMDLWRRWVSRMHSIFQVLDEVKGEDGKYGEGIRPAQRRRWRVVVPAVAALLVLAAAARFVYVEYFEPEPPPFIIQHQVATVPDSSSLTIHTEPAGAMIFLADQRLGRSPIDGRPVAAGSQALTVELDGYKIYTDTLELVKDEPQEREVILVRREGSLRINSQPAGARVIMNGENTGLTTPATMSDLPVTEQYQIRLQLAGYRDGSFSVSVPEDSTLVVNHDFARVTHPLTIVTQPAGASVTFDGEHLGQAPRNLGEVSQGEHRLVVHLAGYQSVSQTVSVPAPGNLVEVALNKLPPGELVIQVQPYADVWIDGELKVESTTFFRIDLDVGDHQVELRHPSYQAILRSVQIESGQTQTVSHNFASG